MPYKEKDPRNHGFWFPLVYWLLEPACEIFMCRLLFEPLRQTNVMNRCLTAVDSKKLGCGCRVIYLSTEAYCGSYLLVLNPKTRRISEAMVRKILCLCRGPSIQVLETSTKHSVAEASAVFQV